MAATEGADFCFGLGDFANSGKRSSLATIARLSGSIGMPFYPTPRNHDLDESPVTGYYAEAFSDRINYTFRQKGWQFVVIDTTDGVVWEHPMIGKCTLAWLDRVLPILDVQAPTVLATHFPLGAEFEWCPRHADEVLARFAGLNLRAVFSGHFHGQTVLRRGDCELITCAGVARGRANHDGTAGKGYWVCDGSATGKLTRTFVPFTGG